MLRSLLRMTLPRTHWGDSLYALCDFRHRQRRWPRGRNPTLFNDHLYKLKVDGSLQDPLRTFVTDKEYVKYYIAAVAGWQHVVETHQILRERDAIDRLVLKRLPCVVKPTHLSGFAEVHVDAKKPLRRDVMKQWFDLDYYQRKREQNYRGLRPKIIVEEFISEDGRTIPDDYKVFCFGGVPKLIQVDSGRFANHTRNLYDAAWNRLPITLKYPGASDTHPKPARLEKMLDLAARLSGAFSFVRVDMYVAGERIMVGELTHCPGSAGEQVHPPTAEGTLGRLFATTQVRV